MKIQVCSVCGKETNYTIGGACVPCWDKPPKTKAPDIPRKPKPRRP